MQSRSALLVTLFLAACAALAADDPASKLEQARALWRDGGYAAAERLIRESIELARAEKKYLALGEAQLAYAQFLRSPAFNDKSFDERRAKLGPGGVREEARRYLRDAEQAYLDAEPGVRASGDPFGMSNLWIWRSSVYQALDDRPRACQALRSALASHREVEDFVKKERMNLGCS